METLVFIYLACVEGVSGKMNTTKEIKENETFLSSEANAKKESQKIMLDEEINEKIAYLSNLIIERNEKVHKELYENHYATAIKTIHEIVRLRDERDTLFIEITERRRIENILKSVE